jgi:hypothetical protein
MRSTTGDSRFSHIGISLSTKSMRPPAEPRCQLMVFCGSGKDELYADRRDRIAGDCERVFK